MKTSPKDEVDGPGGLKFGHTMRMTNKNCQIYTTHYETKYRYSVMDFRIQFWYSSRFNNIIPLNVTVSFQNLHLGGIYALFGL